MGMSDWPEHALAAASHPDPYPYYRALARQGWVRDERLGVWQAASAAAAQDPAAPGEAMDFGRGRHGCPGERLALAIAKGALAALESARPDWEALAGSIRFRHLPNARIRRFGAGEVR
jgi:cytochrome P450